MRTIALLAFVTLGFGGSARAEVKTIPVVCITTEVEVKAAPAAVWKQLTEGQNLVTWCPVWENTKNATIRLQKVGDSLDFTDAWGNGGRSIVTFLAANRELRIAHEPADGSYLCQARVTLAPAGAGTRLTWIEQYTDTSSESDRNATATKMSTEMAAALNALKAGAESKQPEGGR